MNALVAVDLQNDFMPGGALPVSQGDVIVPVINKIQSMFALVVATRDWHPPNHGSFAVNHPGRSPGDHVLLSGVDQTLWPVHCVQHSPGAEFHSGFDRRRIERIFYKGIDPKIDSYSAFFDNAHQRQTGLDTFFKEHGVKEVYLAGLALDYCVLYSALDARKLGYQTFVVTDGCRGIELKVGDVECALEAMRDAGVHLIHSSSLLPQEPRP